MKSRIKRIISFVLVLAMLLSLASCGEYNAAVKKDKDKKPTAEVKPGDNSEGSFTVQLRANEKPYYPTTAIDIYWNDGYNVHVASVDEYGFASISGLDGDYSVTLSSVPSGYAYDSNAYIATNDNRNIIIDMYDLNILRGEGKGLFEKIFTHFRGKEHSCSRRHTIGDNISRARRYGASSHKHAIPDNFINPLFLYNVFKNMG